MDGLLETERAYAAGLFDGEGCVELFMRSSGRNKKGNVDNSLRAALSITGKDQRPLQWLLETFGGYIQQHTHTGRGDKNPVGRWMVTASAADVFAEAIHPYLRVKKEQIEIWQEARSLMYRRGRIPGKRLIGPDEVAHRRSLVARVSELKRTALQTDGTPWPT